VTYVAIGASDAVGMGAGDPATESWPAVLDTLLPQGSKLVNLGVTGITLARRPRLTCPGTTTVPYPAAACRRVAQRAL